MNAHRNVIYLDMEYKDRCTIFMTAHNSLEIKLPILFHICVTTTAFSLVAKSIYCTHLWSRVVGDKKGGALLRDAEIN